MASPGSLPTRVIAAILPQSRQPLDIQRVLRSPRTLLQRDEIVHAHERRGDLRRHIHAYGSFVGLPEIKGSLDEYVHLGDSVGGTVERKDRQPLLAHPECALRRIDKLFKCNRRSRTVAETLERRDGALKIPGIQIEHKVEISRKAHKPVCHDGEPTDHQVPDVRRVQRQDDGFDAPTLHEPILRLE